MLSQKSEILNAQSILTLTKLLLFQHCGSCIVLSLMECQGRLLKWYRKETLCAAHSPEPRFFIKTDVQINLYNIWNLAWNFYLFWTSLFSSISVVHARTIMASAVSHLLILWSVFHLRGFILPSRTQPLRNEGSLFIGQAGYDNSCYISHRSVSPHPLEYRVTFS